MSPQGTSQCEVTDTTVTRLPKGELPEMEKNHPALRT